VAAAAAALTVTFGVSDAALLRALSGEIAPVGKLPINLPRSMSEVREVQEDVGLSATASLYPAGHRVPIASGRYP
jgi:beta-glucosidase